MKRIVAVTPLDVRNGFACCGAVQYAVAADETAAALEQLLADPENGVVILDERLVAGLGEDCLRSAEKRWPGVLVVLPSPDIAGRGEDYAVRLIRRAVGYHVRVRT